MVIVAPYLAVAEIVNLILDLFCKHRLPKGSIILVTTLFIVGSAFVI